MNTATCPICGAEAGEIELRTRTGEFDVFDCPTHEGTASRRQLGETPPGLRNAGTARFVGSSGGWRQFAAVVAMH